MVQNPYEVLIDRLLSLETFKLVAEELGAYDGLLDAKLLETLSRLQAQSADHYTNETVNALYNVLAYFLTQKRLNAFINLGLYESVDYANTYSAELLTQAGFERLEQIIAEHTADPAIQHYLKRKQWFLAEVAGNQFWFADEGWPSHRKLLSNSLIWLTQPGAHYAIEEHYKKNVQTKSYYDFLIDLIERSSSTGIEKVILQGDYNYLIQRINRGQGIEKVPLLRRAIYLIDYIDEAWPALKISLLYDLSDTLQEVESEDRAQNLEEAIGCVLKVLKIVSQRQDSEEWANAQSRLGNLYQARTLGKEPQNQELAISHYKHALKVRTEEARARTLNNLGTLYLARIVGRRKMNLEQAILYFQEALSYVPQDEHTRTWAMIQSGLGKAYIFREQGCRSQNLEIAIEYFANYLGVSPREQFSESWAMTHHDLGLAYYMREQGVRAENLEEARNHFLSALDVRTRGKSPAEWADSILGLGNIYLTGIRGNQTENLEAIIISHQQILDIFTREKYPIQWAVTQNNLGNAYLRRTKGEQVRNIEKARLHYELALEVRTRQNHSSDWAMTQNNLGNVYLNRILGDQTDNLENAKAFYQRALQIYTRRNYPEEWAKTQGNLGEAYRRGIKGKESKNQELAILYNKRALQVYTKQAFPEDWGRIQSNLGILFSERVKGRRVDNLNRAVNYFHQSLQIRTFQHFPVQWALTHHNLGITYKELISESQDGNFEDSIQAFEQALKVRSLDQFTNDFRSTILELGLLYYEEKRYEEARESFEKAHQAVELLKVEAASGEARSLIAQQNATLYRRLIHCCLQVGDLTAAAHYALTAKGRSLTEYLVGQRQSLEELLLQQPELSADWQPIRAMQAELDEQLALLRQLSSESTRLSEETNNPYSSVYLRISQLRREISSRIETLHFQHPVLSNFQALPALPPDQVLQLANDLGGITLVEYIRYGDNWGAFVFTPKEMHFIDLAPNLFSRLSESVGKMIDDAFWNLPDWDTRLLEFYELLISPLEKYFPAAGPLVLAPTSFLHFVPFQAIRDDEGVYLGERYSLTFTPSLATLKVLYEQQKHLRRQNKTITTTLLSVAYSGQGTWFLPNVLPEAKAIRRHFTSAVELHQDDALPERVLYETNLQAFDVIHINSHGGFDINNPTTSGLLLANNRILTLNDIRLRLKLQGRPLVTLSACQTGQIRPENGDETVGLSWAFLVAGASSVISSQWSVPDQSTRELFEAFYELRRQPGISEAEALRQAMQQLRQKAAYRHQPYCWAAFQVIGLPISET